MEYCIYFDLDEQFIDEPPVENNPILDLIKICLSNAHRKKITIEELIKQYDPFHDNPVNEESSKDK